MDPASPEATNVVNYPEASAAASQVPFQAASPGPFPVVFQAVYALMSVRVEREARRRIIRLRRLSEKFPGCRKHKFRSC